MHRALIAVIAQQLIPLANGKGRILATEILMKNYAVGTHIREAKTHQTRSTMETSKGEGMITMDNRLKELYDARKINYEELARRVSSPAFLKQVRPPQSG